MIQELKEFLSFRYHPFHLPETMGDNSEIFRGKMIERKQIKLLSYNLYMRPPPVKTNICDFKEERLKEFIKYIRNFDILCLQEIFTTMNSRKQRLIQFAEKQGFLYKAVSPQPSIFSNFYTDAGLLILSRFPIIEQQFMSFPYGVLSDSLSQKGVLYAKIKVNGSHIHLFNTHTQASYFGINVKYFVATYQTRHHQLNLLKKFVEQKTQNSNEDDLIIVTGDFNVNGHKENKKTISYIEQMSHNSDLVEFLKEVENEYDLMIDFLSKNGNDEVVDCLKLAYNGELPTTYGDKIIDEYGNVKAAEIILTEKEDLQTCQCLDYIFQIKKKPSQDQDDSPSISRERENIRIPNVTQHPLSLIKRRTFYRQVYNEENKEQELNSNKKQLKIDIENTQIEKFEVQGQIFTQLSDHYGVSTTMSFK